MGEVARQLGAGQERRYQVHPGNTRSPAKAAAFCSENAIELVDDYGAVLADPAIDAVVLAKPHSQHGDQIVRAATAGKHVFVEKPFTLTSREAREALVSAAKAKIVLAVGFNRRFHPSMAELRNRVREERLGVVLLHCERDCESFG